MKDEKRIQFNWDVLLARIKSKNIIPVVGLGVYWVQEDGSDQSILLYDHLAKKLSEEIGYSLNPEENNKFSKVVFEYFKKNKYDYNPDYRFMASTNLREILLEILSTVKLAPDNPLWKLARIKSFNLFINTTFDDFFVDILHRVRKYPTKFLSYTQQDKKLSELTGTLFKELKKSKQTLVYNIYGNLRERIESAFTEKDMLETIVSFQMDMVANPKNRLSQKLRSSSLLFMGCGYDDWLFRFFIRSMSNQEYQYPGEAKRKKYVSDMFGGEEKYNFNKLQNFLTSYDSDVYSSCSGKEFVDTLYRKLEKFPELIIPEAEFPETAFISFHGANREVAFKLEKRLRDDGISVWVDKQQFEPGDEVDATIISAMEKCPVFIPLISRESKELYLPNGNMKYHCQEWNWVYLFNNDKEGLPRKTIIPVVIDNTDWMYERFKNLNYVKIPGGSGGEYDKLKEKLLEFQLPQYF
jgi:hypothetical protein